ncbi:hypothetical protein chiPu_0024906, partial [Chiloscyllium punctatum]|nr:hypothetical protein [Chiloscyllium punctatum]
IKKPPLAPKPKLQNQLCSAAVSRLISSPIPKSGDVSYPLLGSRGAKPPIAPKPNLANKEPVVGVKLTLHGNSLSGYADGTLSLADPQQVLNIDGLSIPDTLDESEDTVLYPERQLTVDTDVDEVNTFWEGGTTKTQENRTPVCGDSDCQEILHEFVQSEDKDLTNMDPCFLCRCTEVDCVEGQPIVVSVGSEEGNVGVAVSEASQETDSQETPQTELHSPDNDGNNVSITADQQEYPGEEADCTREEA